MLNTISVATQLASAMANGLAEVDPSLATGPPQKELGADDGARLDVTFVTASSTVPGYD
jgi:hypothetical protein